jgi:rubrerythrin
VSRIPRFQEHLKTGFTAEAVSAACYRAYGSRAEKEGLPNLAAKWRELAAEKDKLAVLQLEAAGKVRDGSTALRDALAEDQYENDVLYPKMIREVEDDTAEVFRQVVAAQQEHVESLSELRQALQASTDDL